MSSELPFCKTVLLRKQLISPILFGRSKIGKKDVVLHGLGNRKICNRNVSVKAGFVNYFSKLFVDFRKLDLFSKTARKIFGFLLIYP